MTIQAQNLPGQLVAEPYAACGVWFACPAYPECNGRHWAKADGAPDYDNPPKN